MVLINSTRILVTVHLFILACISASVNAAIMLIFGRLLQFKKELGD